MMRAWASHRGHGQDSVYIEATLEATIRCLCVVFRAGGIHQKEHQRKEHDQLRL